MKLSLLHPEKISEHLVEEIAKNHSVSTVTFSSPRLAHLLLKEIPNTENRHRLRQHCMLHQVDVIFQKRGFQPDQIQLLAMDMDSTLINIECIDEIAAEIGRKKEVSEITEAAMRGEIKDFSESLRRRVELLAGVPETALDEVYKKRLRLNPGAAELIQGAKARGWHTLLVSGGFTFFTDKLAKLLNLHETHANTLEVSGGLLTGKVIGPIVDGAAKAAFVQARALAMQKNTACALVIGDGSNDLPMMEHAGLSIAYRAKPIVNEKADGSFNHVGLDAILELFPV